MLAQVWTKCLHGHSIRLDSSVQTQSGKLLVGGLYSPSMLSEIPSLIILEFPSSLWNKLGSFGRTVLSKLDHVDIICAWTVLWDARICDLRLLSLILCSCLDRTNVAQFSAGVEAMEQQLVVMGIRSNAKLDPSSNIVRVLIDMYVDIGDHVSVMPWWCNYYF